MIYQEGNIFSEEAIIQFKKISKIALAKAIYSPIKYSLLSIVATFFNPVGERMISIAITSDDVFNIFITNLLHILRKMCEPIAGTC